MKYDSLQNLLADRFAAAIAAVAGPEFGPVDPAVRPAGDPQFGDYQCNAAMMLARPLKAKPRDIAQRIKDAVSPALADIAEPLEIAGPGFINIRLKDAFLAQYLGDIPRPDESSATATSGVASAPRGRRRTPGATESTAQEQWHQIVSDRVGLEPVEHPQRVVVEYSQPNIAKQMHVGHLRSTIIGDVFARVLAFEGHDVIRQNHIGDWGTQFGLVILGLWHICMARDRGDPMYVREMLVRLEDSAGPDDRIKAFHEVESQHDKDYKRDSEDGPDTRGKVIFLPFLKRIHADKSISLDEIELAYRYANRLQEISKELEGDPYHGLPQTVTHWLQLGEDQERLAWDYCRAVTLEYCSSIYSRLGVLLSPDDIRGESFYSLGDDQNPEDRLAEVLEELQRRFGDETISVERRLGTGCEESRLSSPTNGHARAPKLVVSKDAGAIVAYLYDEKGQPLFKDRDGERLGMIVQKSNEAYLYATTDLAAIRFRLKELQFRTGNGAQRVIYVTDARQKLHFEMFFAVARAAGWLTDQQVEHVTFGSVLGADRKPLKTRAGGTIKLSELLDEAANRAVALLEAREDESRRSKDQAEEPRTQPFSKDEKQAIAQSVGVASVKYADLRNDRNADYVFDWDKMISFQGNTAPYMMYAYARIRSIYRKAAERFGSPDVYAPGVGLAVAHPTERALALRLARLREAIDNVAADLTPHTLCTYLYELAAEFMRFYESCPVLAADDEASRLSRMRLCDLTARTLKLGLGLLGIDIIERM